MLSMQQLLFFFKCTDRYESRDNRTPAGRYID